MVTVFFTVHVLHCYKPFDKESSRSVLENLGINDAMSMFEIDQLRHEMVVDEWLNNPERYQPFVSANVVSEACLFLQSGYFMGELGNTMPLALSNVLSTPLMLFTSMETMPVLLITPSTIRDAIPCLYLGFNQFGAGHYDAISIRNSENNERSAQLGRNKVSGSILSEVTHSSQSNHKCSCGQNSNRNTPEKLFCTYSNTYSTRCPCFKSKSGCQEGCSCKKCENPHGKRNLRSLLTLSPGPSRKRTETLPNNQRKQW